MSDWESPFFCCSLLVILICLNNSCLQKYVFLLLWNEQIHFRNMSLIPDIHSWNLTNYARRLNSNSTSKNEYFWSCLHGNQTSLKMTIISSDQCIEELIGNEYASLRIRRDDFFTFLFYHRHLFMFIVKVFSLITHGHHHLHQRIYHVHFVLNFQMIKILINVENF
jgi:hypothetical protein